MRVEDVMTREVFTCDTRANLASVARVMWEHDCGCVPIVSWSDTLMGLVTDRDVAMAAYIQDKRLADISVMEVMSRHLNACEVGASVQLARQIMRDAKLRRLPVIDRDGKLVGLVTWSDLFAASQHESTAAEAEAAARDALETLDIKATHRR